MVNRLSADKQAAILSALVEGTSIRSVERMTSVHRDTITRLLVRAGDTSMEVMDVLMRDLPSERIEVDEMWCYVGKKQAQVRDTDNPLEVGDMWTWVALDPDLKIVPTYHVGKRTSADAKTFMRDLSWRLKNRVQLNSDALGFYVAAVEEAFRGRIDYATVIKSYESAHMGSGRYSPPRKVAAVKKAVISGDPDLDVASTSLVERQNLTMRMHMRRMTRLTNAFSKKRANLEAAVALHFAWYNFVRPHKTLKTTPAIAAGITNRRWTMADLVGLSR